MTYTSRIKQRKGELLMQELELLDKAREIYIQLKKDSFDETEIRHIISILKAINESSVI